MIKLNNKNITYVALADSNNSLKAPKEIWYADSNNSVKLVYRRKDALIEGEDYEKYHWLIAEIPINVTLMTLPINSDTLYYKRIWKTFGNTMYFETDGYAYFTPFNKKIEIYDRENNRTIYSSSSSINIDDVVEVNSSGNATLINNIELQQYGFPILDIRFYNANNATVTGISLTSAVTVDGIERYTPCKLLKPVPKWLDANGIRRNVGECGMIDLVSGKFYGNVNNVGTFTVENYYERKERLVGDGSAYIDTNIIVDVPSLYISTSFTKKVNVEITSPLFGSRDNIYSNGSQIFYQNGKLRFDIITNEANWITVDSSDIQNINQLIVDCPNKVININEITLSSGVDDLSIKNSSNTFKIYSLELLNASDGNSVPYNGSFGNFTLNDSTHSLDLIPCTLTMDLPASMDANNIARTKGTSGMWDLVSDRFYGNVANSGTFKAVNLAEGVDYEVHQWLRCVFVDRVSDTMYLPVNSYSFAFSRKPLKGNNVPYFYTEGGDIYLYSTTDDTIRIWNSTQYGYYYSGTSFNWGDTISIVSFSNSLEVNSQVIPQNTFPCKYVYFGANSTNGAEHYTSKITVDGIERYIPVKLLKAIPSKYDANGIARQAGECGMYDTVNDVFYGNVASSGSFSCVNDS